MNEKVKEKKEINDDTPLSMPQAADYLDLEYRTFTDWVKESVILQSAFFPINEFKPKGKRITNPRRLRMAFDRLADIGQNISARKFFVIEKTNRRKAA